MVSPIKPMNYWTKEKCQEEAMKYNSKNEFSKYSKSAYGKASENKWIDEICLHMNIKITKERGYWIKEKCQEEALKYKLKSEFRKYSRSAYEASWRNNWLCDFFIKK